MPIIFGMRYTATVKGSAMKRAECESCNQAYHYKVERTAKGWAFSLAFLDNDGASERASCSAETALKTALDKAVDPVACPTCGHYQKNMVWQGKWRRLGWTFGAMTLIAFTLYLVAAAHTGHRSARPYYTAALITEITGFVLSVVWFIAHNPNRRRRADVASRGIPEETASAKYSRSEDLLRADMYRAVRDVMLMTAAADGGVNDVEFECVARLSKTITESTPDPDVLRIEAAAFACGDAHRHTQIHAQLADLTPFLQDEDKAVFIKAALIVASADGQVVTAERDVLARIGASLHMTARQINAVSDQLNKPAIC